MNTGISTGFRTVVNGNDKDITREVIQFEANVAAALKQVEVQAWPKLAPTNLKTADYTAQEDDLVPCAGTFKLTLPVASAQNAGRSIGVIIRSGTVTVLPTSGLVQGGTSDLLGVVGFHIYISDGIGWYRN